MTNGGDGLFGADSAWDPASQTHAEWKRARILQLQRDRRASMRRIDYYASERAAAVIDGLRRPSVGGDASSILDRIVLEWAARSGISTQIRAGARAGPVP